MYLWCLTINMSDVLVYVCMYIAITWLTIHFVKLARCHKYSIQIVKLVP